MAPYRGEKRHARVEASLCPEDERGTGLQSAPIDQAAQYPPVPRFEQDQAALFTIGYCDAGQSTFTTSQRSANKGVRTEGGVIVLQQSKNFRRR